jgi:hypothetical protein
MSFFLFPQLALNIELYLASTVRHSFIASALCLIGPHHSGNGGLTFDEAKSHFTSWALMKSPLLVRYQFVSCETLVLIAFDRLAPM